MNDIEQLSENLKLIKNRILTDHKEFNVMIKFKLDHCKSGFLKETKKIKSNAFDKFNLWEVQFNYISCPVKMKSLEIKTNLITYNTDEEMFEEISKSYPESLKTVLNNKFITITEQGHLFNSIYNLKKIDDIKVFCVKYETKEELPESKDLDLYLNFTIRPTSLVII